MDIRYSKLINGKKYEVSIPYHGGQVSGDVYSLFFGIVITDDGHKNEFIKKIRSSNYHTYEEDYKEFLQCFIQYLREDGEYYGKFINDVIVFTTLNQPDFYSVESSS